MTPSLDCEAMMDQCSAGDIAHAAVAAAAADTKRESLIMLAASLVSMGEWVNVRWHL